MIGKSLNNVSAVCRLPDSESIAVSLVERLVWREVGSGDKRLCEAAISKEGVGPENSDELLSLPLTEKVVVARRVAFSVVRRQSSRFKRSLSVINVEESALREVTISLNFSTCRCFVIGGVALRPINKYWRGNGDIKA